MKHSYFRHWLLLLAFLISGAVQAQIEPAAQYTKLTVAQFMAWTPTGSTSLPANVSQVPLATRQNSLVAQLNPAMSFTHKVNYVPDGMANFAGYLNEQNHFNLYNFTHWQYIDVLTWFDGPIGVPCRPWVETAHRNGVKVIGSVFTSASDVAALIQKDAAGNYLAAQKLVDMANYYRFDGWFFNQESPVSAATATELRNLLKQLQTLRPTGMEIHWYDAMVPSGAIAYQNALNTNNQLLFQEGSTRVSDAMFTNYFWSGATTINTSVTTATNLGRSPFEVYMGADLWPGRSNQSLFANSTWINNYFANGDLSQPRLSLGLFGTNLTYNGGQNNFSSNPADYRNFYRTEQRMFAGNDFDITTADATGWKGFGHYVPVRSVIHQLPFETSFSVGQGQVFANNGVQIVKEWTDMAKQSLLPSWQWAKTGTAPVTVGFDFDRAYYAGTSVRLAGSLSGSNSATVKLYQTKLAITNQTNFDVIYKAGAVGATSTKLALYFTDNLAAPVLLDLPAVTDTLWRAHTFSLAAQAGRELAIIGVQAISPAPVAAYSLNLGKLKVYNGPATAVVPTVGFTANSTTVLTNQTVTLANSSTNATGYTWTFVGGTPSTSTTVHPSVSYATPGTYSVKLRAESAAGRDSLTRTGYITVVAPAAPGGNTALLFDGVGKYVDAGAINLSNSTFSMECWVKANTFKSGSPFISSLMGIEDGGNNTALVRLGDAGITGDRLQFVAQIGGVARKLNATITLAAGTWYHVAATYDGTAMRLYLNGALNATLNVTGAVTANAAFSFGRNYANSRCLDGSLDEVRVWKRALTAAEILANPCDVPVNSPSLEGYWKCDEATGNVTQDLSGHFHTGTLISMVPSDWSPLVPTQCARTSTAVLPAQAAALRVFLLGNPVAGSTAAIEIQGAQHQPATVLLVNALGAVVFAQQVQPTTAIAQYVLPLAVAPGLYVLRVKTPTGTAATKLLKL